MDGLLIVLGILALIGGGIGYVAADGNLNDIGFLFDNFGSGNIKSMNELRNISQYAIIIGILMIMVGVILYAVNAGKRNAGVASVNNQATPVVPVALVNANASAVRVCKTCGKPLASAGTFCPYCGTDNTPNTRRCTCGCALDDDAVFCPSCGKKIVT